MISTFFSPESLIKLCLSGHKMIEESEDFRTYKRTEKGRLRKTIKREAIIELIDNLSSRDSLTLSVLENGAVSFSFSSSETEIDSFLGEWKDFIDISGSATVEIKLAISKKQENCVVSIFSLSLFSNFLAGRNILDLSILFSKFLENNTLHFEVNEEIIGFRSASIGFLKKGMNFTIPQLETQNRKSSLESAKRACRFENQDINLYPQDFDFDENLDSSQQLKSLFEKLRITYSLVFLFDNSKIDQDKLSFHLKGFRIFEGTLDLNDKLPSIEYFQIYSWVYDGGNVIDKIGLARNMLSIHLRDPKTLVLASGILDSIKSSYTIYLKENIGQYLELRKSASTELSELASRSRKIEEAYISTFQKGTISFLSYFASIFIVRVITSGKFGGSFSKEATLIGYAFILIGLAYFELSNWEVRSAIRRNRNEYEKMKESFEGLFLTTDIAKILNDDKDFDEYEDESKERIKYYKWLWIVTIILSYSLILFFSESFKQFLFGCQCGN